MDFKSFRNSLGLSQAGMARACGVHRQTWVKWERKESVPSASAVRLVETMVWLKSIGWFANFVEKFSK